MTMVELAGMPVPSWVRIQEHTDALVREFRLMRTLDASQISPELRELFAVVTGIFDRSAVPVLRNGIRSAIDTERQTTDLVVDISPQQATDLRALHEALTGIDEYCRRGVLLTLPISPEAVALRTWVVEEVQRQLAGQAPRPYEEPWNARVP